MLQKRADMFFRQFYDDHSDLKSVYCDITGLTTVEFQNGAEYDIYKKGKQWFCNGVAYKSIRDLSRGVRYK